MASQIIDSADVFNQPNMTKELTYKTYFDQINFAAGATFKKQRFFQNDAKDSSFRNLVLAPNASLTTGVQIIGIQVQHNLKFAVTGAAQTGMEKALQEGFENLSVFQWRKESKTYPPIPLFHLLNHRWYTNGGTLTAREIRTDYYPLRDPINVTPGGEMEFEIIPPTDMALHATPTAFLPNASLTDNIGFFIRVLLFAKILRQSL